MNTSQDLMMTADAFHTDVLIIGAGPVGLFSIFECGMLQLRCHVIDALESVGGQLTALYPEKPIYDIPGAPAILAQDLIDNLVQQATPFHPTYHLQQKALHLTNNTDQTVWTVTTTKQTTIHAKAIILATGGGAFGPNRPHLDQLEKYEGRSVFYHVANPDRFAGKRVVIAGGGDSAMDWALALYPKASRVTVVHRRQKFRGAPANEEKLKNLAQEGKIDLLIPFQLQALEGLASKGRLDRVIVNDLDGNEHTVPADYLLAFFGLSCDWGALAHWGLTIENKGIVVKPGTYETSQPGIYAVGDVASYAHKLKLILTGFAEAAGAAQAIWRRLFPEKVLRFQHSTTKGITPLG